VKRIAFAVLAAAVLMACARSGGGTLPPDTGIRGKVVSGPHCPVERADSPCPDQPVEAVVIATSSTGEVAKKARSNPQGEFSMDIPAGTYVLTVEGLTGISFAKPVTVTVRPGAFTQATVVVDTGIRVPQSGSG
jgi:hypothetical protein